MVIQTERMNSIMAEDKKKSIPIEDGTEIEEKDESEKNTEAGGKARPAEEPDIEKEKGEENEEIHNSADENAEADEADEDPAKEVDKEPSAEEQESERYMRLMAEFQNFKRRAAKEKSDIHAFANERIVNDLLPVLDNFERALEGDDSRNSENEELANYAKGMELIFEQLRAALKKAGLKEIEALGQDFDPNVHNAVMTDQTDEYEDGKVSKVMQKGYKLNDKVVRPSMVAVNKNS